MTLAELYRTQPMRRTRMDDTQRSLITLALREKAQADAKLAAVTENERLAYHLERQAKQALALAEQLEEADSIVVHVSREF